MRHRDVPVSRSSRGGSGRGGGRKRSKLRIAAYAVGAMMLFGWCGRNDPGRPVTPSAPPGTVCVDSATGEPVQC